MRKRKRKEERTGGRSWMWIRTKTSCDPRIPPRKRKTNPKNAAQPKAQKPKPVGNGSGDETICG